MRACLAVVVFLGAVVVGSAASAEPTYVGSNKCKKCHLKQYKSWEKTKMANAFEQLKPNVAADAKKKAGLDPAKDYSADAKCVKCHTTGYGKAGGYGSGKIDDQLAGVGCEACHGPGSEYLADDKMSNKNKEFKTADLKKHGFYGRPTKELCVGCHNEESPFYKPFDFDKRVKEGTHEHHALKYKH